MDLESTQEREGKQNENAKEDEVHPDVGREVVEAKRTHNGGEDETKSNVDQDNRRAVNKCFKDTLAARFGLFGKKRNGHWDHREHARR